VRRSFHPQSPHFPFLLSALEQEEQISAKDLKDLESAIETLADEKNFDIDREELNHLKEDVEEYQEVC
jgi:hypothetical protein